MKPSYTYIDHTADVLFEAVGNTLGEVFEQCGLALENTQVHLEKVQAKEKQVLKVEAKDEESLLFDFLDDLVFEKDANLMIFSKFECNIEEKDGRFHLKCMAFGEKLNVERHEPKVDVKAITMHMFEIKKTEEGWKATVLVDI
jgi:SHS2 domain-containing protein